MWIRSKASAQSIALAAAAAVVASGIVERAGVAGTIRTDRADSLYTALGNDPKYAAVGAIRYDIFELGLGSGTLISPRWVLTAGHVVDDTSTHAFRYGGTDGNGGTRVQAAQIIAYPTWDANNIVGGHDVGLMRLSSAVTSITPASRFTGTNDIGQLATTVGFGVNGTGSSGMNIFDMTFKKRAGENTIDVPGTAYGAGSNDTYAGLDFDDPGDADGKNPFGSATPRNLEYCVAEGDSGGPTFVEIGGRPYIAGVTSFIHAFPMPTGDGNDDATYSDTYAITRVAQFNTWIDDNITIGWNTAASGSFATGTNWSTSAAPASGDIAGFNVAGTYTVTFSGAVTNTRLLARAGNVTLNLQGNTYTLDSPTFEGSFIVGKYSGNSATINVGLGTLSTKDAVIAELAGSTGSVLLNAGATWNCTTSAYVGGSFAGAGGTGSIVVNAGATLSVAGNLQLWGGGTLTTNGGTATLNSVTGAGAINSAGGTMTANTIRGPALAFSGTGSGHVKLNADGSAAGTSVLAQLTFAGATNAWGGQLDVTNDDVIVHSTSGNRVADVARMTNQIKQGANFAQGNAALFWTGNGITTSLGGNGTSGFTALGITYNDLQAAGQPGSAPIYTSFDGQSVGVNDVLIKYTWFGDADLNGQVNSSDYFQIDTGFLAGRTGWINGDFDYSGSINSSDYFLIDAAFLAQGSTVLAPAATGGTTADFGELSRAVPEPAWGGVLLAGAAVFNCLRGRRGAG